MKNFFIDFNGCQRNHIDAEMVSGLLTQNRFRSAAAPEKADIIIFMGCGFTEEARQETIDSILELSASKKKNAVLAVGGCIFRRHRTQLKKSLPEVDLWVNGSNPEIFLNTLKSMKESDEFQLPELEGRRDRYGLSHIGLVKISEGCLNACSYCAIPHIRGCLRSRKVESILDEFRRLQDEGCSEIILVSQDSTSFGLDSSGRRLLPILIEKIEKTVNKDVRYRIPYLDPRGFDDKLIDSVALAENLIKCLDIPVQHFSDRLLKKMNRNYTRKYLIDLFSRLRERIENAAFRTTFITGFFKETDKDVEVLLSSARKIGFERSGVFPYSREECTPAENFQGIPEKKEAKRRLNRIRKELSEIMFEKDKSRIGVNVKAIIEGYAGNYAVARTDWDMPDVDKTVFIRDENRELTSGKWIEVRINVVRKKAIYAEKVL